jgi:hypothetical protein
MQKTNGTRREKRQWVSRCLGVCVSFLEFMIVGRVGDGVGEFERREREREREKERERREREKREREREREREKLHKLVLITDVLNTRVQAFEEREVELFKPCELLNDSCVEFWIE